MPRYGRASVLLAAYTHKIFSPSQGYDCFRPLVEEAKIDKIAFLRHGQTAPASNGVDFDRILTDTGREQCRSAGTLFGRRLRPFYSPILVSPAPRTVETTRIFLEASEETTVEIKLVDELYDGTMQPQGSALFRTLGYAPLRDYLSNPDESIKTDAQRVLGDYAESSVEAIMKSLQQNETKTSTTMWIVAHAIYLPAAALAVGSILRCDGLDVISSTNTKEAEGYLIDVEKRSVVCMFREESR
mmetsp:Transcript_28182/g.42635  ORF Transcript_28182/g.42635 Transcript_28182/m.42635 type:complete len:243 (+) Transcript_28182:164-892(+)